MQANLFLSTDVSWRKRRDNDVNIEERNIMTKKTILLIACCIIAILPLSAQNENGQKQGTVTVNQSQEINDLVFGKAKKQDAPANSGKKAEEKTSAPTGTRTPATTSTTTKPANTISETEAPSQNPATETRPTQPRIVSPSSSYGTETTQTDISGKKVMRNGFKIQGYRVQVFAGGNKREDRIKAQNMGRRIKAAFPNQPVYTHFHSPRWTCRIGNFRKKETADRIVKQARNKGFDQACVVSEKITVQYR